MVILSQSSPTRISGVCCTLGYAGFGYLRPGGVRRKLEEMARLEGAAAVARLWIAATAPANGDRLSWVLPEDRTESSIVKIGTDHM